MQEFLVRICSGGSDNGTSLWAAVQLEAVSGGAWKLEMPWSPSGGDQRELPVLDQLMGHQTRQAFLSHPIPPQLSWGSINFNWVCFCVSSWEFCWCYWHLNYWNKFQLCVQCCVTLHCVGTADTFLLHFGTSARECPPRAEPCCREQLPGQLYCIIPSLDFKA